MAAGDSKITLNLLVDTHSNTVLFGETGNDLIDFLFSLLTLPLGSVIKLLSPLNMTGSIGKLYQSVEKLNETYLVKNRDKSSLLQPKVATFDVASPLSTLLQGTESIVEPKYFLCNYCNRKVSTMRNIMCTNCMRGMSTEVDFVVPASSAGAGNGEESVGGFVTKEIKYVITDDLEVAPSNGDSFLSVYNRFLLKKDLQQLEWKVVTIGMKEGLALLEASLESTTVLTDVFCSSAKKRKAPSVDDSTEIDVPSLEYDLFV